MVDNLAPNFFGDVEFHIQTHNLLLLVEDTCHCTKPQRHFLGVCVCCVTYQKQLVHASPKYTYPAYHYRKSQSHLGSISKQDNPLRLRLRHTHTQTKLTKLTLILHICKQTHYISTYFAPRKSNFNFKSTKTSASKTPNIINHNLNTKFKTITIIIINT